MRKTVVVGFAALATVALACSSGDGGKGPGEGGSNTGNAAHNVLFEVTGSGVTSASTITYGLGANISQAGDASLPWSKSAESNDAITVASLSAQAGEGTGTISCRIVIDGTEKVKNSSQGQFSVVTCTAS